MFLAEDSASPPGQPWSYNERQAHQAVVHASISAGAVTGGSVIADPDAWVSGTIPNHNVGWQLTANVFK